MMDDMPQPDTYSLFLAQPRKMELPMQVIFDSLCQRIEAEFTDVPEHEGLHRIDTLVADERSQHRIDKSD